jgi:pimeloyl-ACP methyl ester carboxylesterase
MDDLDAIRAALGYPQLDVYGISYGATAAQVYLKRHPRSVRTLTLAGATALDVSFYGRFARNSQRALDRIAALCSADSDCRRSFPGWERQFAELVRAWDANPVENRKGEHTTGAGLAGVVQGMLLDVTRSVSIPLLVHAAARGSYAPLNRAIAGAGGGNGKPAAELLMYWSIWCREPWVGLDAKGPWGTAFDSYARVSIAYHAGVCARFPTRPEPRSRWTFPHGTAPVLAIAGGADPQDPLANLPRLRQSFPDSRAVPIPYYGHDFPLAGCVADLVSSFVARGTTKGLDTQCVAAMVPPPFELP